MFVPNQIIRAKRTQMLAKVKFIDSKKDTIQIEYLNPQHRNYFGLFSYPLKDVKEHWEVVDNPDNKVISLVKNNHPEPVSCSHNWVKYNGFIENYEFCSKCDKKK